MKKLVFNHIPKCAGGSLRTIILPCFRRATVVQCYPPAVDSGEGPRLSQLISKQCSCIFGHLFFDIDRSSIPADWICASMMRDPVRRIISHYRYVKRHPNHYMHDAIAKRGMTLSEYASQENFIELDNGQVRQLAGLIEPIPLSQEDFDMARKKIFDAYDLIGTLDNVDAFLMRLGSLLRCDMPAASVRRNRSPQDQADIDPQALAVIRSRNIWDQQLYDEIRQRNEASDEVVRSGSGHRFRAQLALNLRWALWQLS